MTTKELLAKLNVLRARAGKTELTSWKSGRDKLESTIADLVEELGDVDDEELDNPVAELVADLAADMVEKGVISVEEAESLTAEPIIPRGAIGAMSIELLTASDEPYADIVAKIKAIYPTAKTTPRSLASVVMDLRRDGVEVPSRRKPAKVKTDEAAS